MEATPLLQSPSNDLETPMLTPLSRSDPIEKLFTHLNKKYGLNLPELEKLIDVGGPQSMSRKEYSILDNIKIILGEMGLTDEVMMSSYLADFMENPPITPDPSMFRLKKMLSSQDNMMELASPSRGMYSSKNLGAITEETIERRPLATLFGKPISDDIVTLRDWNFNALDHPNFDDKYRLIWTMFSNLNSVEYFDIKPDMFASFIYELQRWYNHRNNPFHNFDHGLMGNVWDCDGI